MLHLSYWASWRLLTKSFQLELMKAPTRRETMHQRPLGPIEKLFSTYDGVALTEVET